MSKRLDRQAALNLATCYRFPLSKDWHALSTDEQDGVLAAADAHGYRKPRNANGSRGRYFHGYVRRAAERDE